MTKICTKCKIEQPTTEFYKQAQGKDGLYPSCKLCGKEIKKQYYIQNKDKFKECDKQYKLNNKDELTEYHKQYDKDNKEKITEYQKQYHKQYKKNNKEKFIIAKQKRRARKKELPCTLTFKQWEEIKLHFNNCCSYCGQEKPLQQEHFIPLSKGGAYSKENIIPACKSCNVSKKDRSFLKWYPLQPFYNKEREIKITLYI